MSAEITRVNGAPVEVAPKLSLFDIEQSLAMLMQDRDEVTDPEEVAAVEQAIQQYIGAEIAKVDGCLAYLRKAQEMKAGAERMAKMYGAHVDRLKAAIFAAMQVSGKKRLEGTCGSFLLKGNGGLAPLKVQEEVLPDDYRDVSITLPLVTFRLLQESNPVLGAVKVSVSVPANGRIRDALKDGPVPGAWLDDRGSHLEVK